MTDPVKALADAARKVVGANWVKLFATRHCDPEWSKGIPIAADKLIGGLADALAAYDAAHAQPAPSDAEIENQRIRMVAQFRAVKVLAALGEDCHSLASECEKGEVMVAETFALIARLRGGAS